jgi:N-methylhydantoinase A
LEDIQKQGGDRRYRAGIDVGGTFTDVVLVGEASGEILTAKVATVPADPSRGCIHGIDKALARYGLEPGQISFTVHGTTVATNTIIQRKYALAGLITSEGFRDVLEIAYQTRPKLYDIFYDKPGPLVPRYLARGVPERIGPDGEVIVPLDEDAVRAVARELVAAGVEAIAVAFLHAYRDPTHERRAGHILAQECGALPIVLSSDISPEYREYPRTSTTVVNAVLLPRVGPYIARLEQRLETRGIRSGLHFMTSAGGIIAAGVARRQPVHLVESGPAAGVIGATFVARLSGYDNLLALDIGGTTAKAAVVNQGEPQIAEQFEVGSSAVATVTAQRGHGYPVLTPVISLVEIGAGGGSIGKLDPGGALTVGPESAGADPGPACYGLGGTAPTLTDANLVLGRLNPDYFLGGETKLDPALAERAVLEQVAAPAGLEVLEAARAIVDIANASMTSALYFISVEQGIDPREYVLVPSGGAGPMQAVAIAAALGVRRILIPPTPGLNSALGLLATDLKHETVRTNMKEARATDPEDLRAIFDEMEATTRALLREEGVAERDVRISREIAMCYVGQSYQLKVPVPDRLDADTARAMTDAFHRRHAEAYGFANEPEPTQFVNLRLIGIGRVERPRLRTLVEGDGSAARALKARRPVYFQEAGGMINCATYDRAALLASDVFEGPAIVEQMDTTTVVPPGARVTVYQNCSLLIEVGAG